MQVDDLYAMARAVRDAAYWHGSAAAAEPADETAAAETAERVRRAKAAVFRRLPPGIGEAMTHAVEAWSEAARRLGRAEVRHVKGVISTGEVCRVRHAEMVRDEDVRRECETVAALIS